MDADGLGAGLVDRRDRPVGVGDVGDRHARALTGQCLRIGDANADAGPGNDGDFSVQSAHVSLLE